MADDAEHERFDPTRLVGRWSAVLLALAGVALVLLPSTQFGWADYKGGWAATPTRWIADLAALIGCGIAFAIAWSRTAHRAAPLAGAAFGAAAIAWGLQSADAALAVEGVGATGLRIARLEAWLLAAALLSAFCTRFPRALTDADFEAMQQRLAAGHIGTGLPTAEDPFAAMDAPLGGIDRLTARLFGPRYAARVQAAQERLRLGGPRSEPPWLRAYRTWAQRWLFRDIWLLILVMMPVVAAAVWWGDPRRASLPFAITAAIGLVSCIGLRFGILAAGPDDRRRILWIAAGVVAAFAASLTGFWAFIAAGLTGHMLIGLGVFILSAPVAALLLVLGFVIAIFGGGALDPGLAIKRTVVAGIVATLLTFTFALVEGFVATFLAEQLGLPTAAAPAVASAAVAVALGPMWRKVSGWVGAKLGVDPGAPGPNAA